VLAFYVQRELLDALCEDPAKACGPDEASLRLAHAELLPLRKPLQQQPGDERRAPSAPSAFPLPYGWSSLASSAKETFKRLWPGEVEPSGAPSLVRGASIPMRTRSSSVSGRMARRRATVASLHHRRSLSSSASVDLSQWNGTKSTSNLWRRTSSVDCCVKEERQKSSLDEQVQDTMEALCGAMEDGNCRLAALERGVRGLCLPVQEDDVGSVITHALLSRQFHEQMSVQWASVTGGRSSCCPLASFCGDEWSCYASFPASLCTACSAPPTRATSSTALPASASADVQNSRQNLADMPWKRLPGLARSPWEDEWERQGVRSVLTALPQEQPIRVEFEDKEAKYYVAIHHAAQFHILRHWLCGDDLNFARSLYRCNRIKPSGGKTSAAFFVSQHDRRFLLKAVNRAEFRMLTTPEKAQAMFSYVDQVLFDKVPSVLAHVVGLFSVSVKLHKKSREMKPKHFIVQRNLRFGLQIQKRPHFVFDLKGVGNRKVRDVMPGGEQAHADDSDVGEAEASAGLAAASGNGNRANGGKSRPSKAVLWDMNLREWTDGKPLCLLSQDLKYLEAALHNDTSFLNKQSLVDYSLLLAAAEPPDEGSPSNEPGTLALGIIDWLRPYTWDKHMEFVVKNWAQAHRPTVIEPSKYARRFLDAMGTFFVAETPPPPSSG